jgi:hypothetical protein
MTTCSDSRISALSHPIPTKSRTKTRHSFIFLPSKRENSLKVQHQTFEANLKSGVQASRYGHGKDGAAKAAFLIGDVDC